MTTVDLFHTDLGPEDAPAVLLVHGWGGDGREWSWHAEAFEDDFRVIVPDLRGHGRSPVPEKENTPVEMAHDLAVLVARLGTGPVVAVGHSMGGQVVNLMAVHHPDVVHSVIALDPAHGAPESDLAFIRPNLAAYEKGGAEEAADFIEATLAKTAPHGLRAAHVRTILGTPGHVIAQAYAGMYLDAGAVGIRPYSEQYLRLRSCPSLTVWTSEAMAAWERTTLHVAESRVEHWAATGHYLHEERPKRTSRLIRDWVQSQ
ncbi:alpha/beta fold hydrolase [Streptomyces himalayensis]|uniref:Alpha/beta hydrolase n=1 Tax=Streptomyces himalayensis subsp. himalayensis TaxID=2756131 RepID=A0A7W0I9U9_9ACTN|nr:alpha/beta hydrolase [Streptomyces himalayensis]MBA2947481.1 alpha/beta hydrolase [Streptomyces himalayensis subsp. himalayensis]